MEKSIAAILQEVLSADRTLLARREELLDVLDKKVPPALVDDYNVIISALEEANVGDIFARGDLEGNYESAKEEAVRRLKEIGTPDTSIDFILQTFERALEWDKPPLGFVPELQRNPAAEKNVSLEKNIEPTDNIPAAEEIHEAPQPADFDEVENNDVPPVLIEKNSDDTGSFRRTTGGDTGRNFDSGGDSVGRNSGSGANKSRSNFLIPIAVIAAVAAAIVGYMFFNREPEPEVEQPVVNNNHLNAKTELSLDGIDLGVSVNRLRELLGIEDFVENRGDYDFYKYGDLDVEVREDKVSALSTGSPELKTLRGLHVGSTYAEVTEAYGADSNDSATANANVYEYPFASLSNEAGILKFVVDKTDRRVTYISARILPQKKEPIDENTKYAARGLFDFHEAVDAKNYDKAYNLMTSNYRALAGTSAQFAEACKDIVSSRIVDLKKVESGEDYVILDYVLDMRKNHDGGKFLYQRFQGRVKMIREAGVWMVDKVDYKKIDEMIEK